MIRRARGQPNSPVFRACFDCPALSREIFRNQKLLCSNEFRVRGNYPNRKFAAATSPRFRLQAWRAAKSSRLAKICRIGWIASSSMDEQRALTIAPTGGEELMQFALPILQSAQGMKTSVN